MLLSRSRRGPLQMLGNLPLYGLPLAGLRKNGKVIDTRIGDGPRTLGIEVQSMGQSPGDVNHPAVGKYSNALSSVLFCQRLKGSFDAFMKLGQAFSLRNLLIRLPQVWQLR